MAALMGAIRAAVSGNTGLNQGQTALAVVQVPQNAAAQNQNPGTQNQQGQAQSGQPQSGQTTATQSGSAQAASGQTSTQVSNGQLATQTNTGQAGAQTAATQQAVQTQPTQAQTTQAAAQAMVNQVKAQTSATMAAAVASATSALKPGANGQLQATLSATSNPVSTSTQNAAAAPQGQTGLQGAASLQAQAQAAQQSTTASLNQLLNPNGSGNNPVRVLIPQTGQSVELPQLKPLPAGTQITLRQAGSAQVDIIKVQLPQNQSVSQNQQTSQNQAVQSNSAIANQAAQKAALQQTAMTALRESLPVQQPVAETLGRIQSLLPQLSSVLRDNPALQQAMQIIDKATLKLSTEASPTGQAVKQSIQRSGVFHEAVMMQALQQAAMPSGAPITPVGDDLKGAFFQIFRQLTRSGNQAEGSSERPPSNNAKVSAEATADGKQAAQTQLARSLQEGLARIRSNQLQSSPATRGAEPAAGAAIQTDIPIALNGQLSEVRVKIDQEVWPEEQNLQPGEEYKRRWVIDLSFSPPELGNLHARLLYQNEKLKTHLWVEQDEQLPGVSKKLHELKERLSALGIEIEEVRCQAGTPQQPPKPGVLSLKA
ncbi:flagellar hook-length control protein FliK [Oceanospirillum sanctuarii]|uniref:flagellar hook-length control protein FliK n=1 Tax=Oceanospirillum sanctuarii TaxID=1434821 RepID=UPI0015943046|nr:flagellar hook-length control protein FliK [Oceanospirillum sanctuarii]